MKINNCVSMCLSDGSLAYSVYVCRVERAVEQLKRNVQELDENVHHATGRGPEPLGTGHMLHNGVCRDMRRRTRAL